MYRPTDDLPPIPEKHYFAIGEVSELCELKPHVLRYWEQEFPELSPTKRRGNRRYYRREDVVLVRTIRQLLYEQGFTLQGAKVQIAPPSQKAKRSRKETLSTLIADINVAINLLTPEAS